MKFASFQLADAQAHLPTGSGPLPLSTDVHGLEDWNFGTVKLTKIYQIDHSQMLGNKGLDDIATHSRANSLLFLKTIIYMNSNGYSEKDKRALEEWQGRLRLGYDFFHSFRYEYRTTRIRLSPDFT